jgi:hypothetical protein
MQPPADMIPELSSKWMNDLEHWIDCNGSYSLAVGYSTVFWPTFVLFEDYILRKGCGEDSVRSWEKQCNGDKRAVEAVLNHIHIADIHQDRKDLSIEKIMFLGRTLKEIWEAKLKWQFPDRPCEVHFIEPDNREDWVDFQLSFWQKKHVKKN